jgi:hypothetical protein
MKSPELLTADYIAQLQAGAEEGRISRDMLQRAMGGDGDFAGRIRALDGILAAVRAQMQALPADVPAPAGFQKHCLIMAIAKLGLPEGALGEWQEALLSEETQALKSFLHLESEGNPDAFALLSLLMQLQGAADSIDAVNPARQQARQEDFPHAGTVDDLPPGLQRLAGPSSSFFSNLPIPELRTGVDAILAHRRASEGAMDDLAHDAPHQLVNYLAPTGHPAFDKDFPRKMNLLLEGTRVDNTRVPDETEETVVQRGYDALAGFLFPGQAFAELEDGQKRQVALLAGLCNQEMEKPALQRALIAFSPVFDEQRMDGICFSSVQGSDRRSIEINRNPGDGSISLRLRQAYQYNLLDNGETQIPLDPDSSTVSVWVDMMVSPGELERVANLDWSGIDEASPIPGGHRLQLLSCRLTSLLHLNRAHPQGMQPQGAA